MNRLIIAGAAVAIAACSPKTTVEWREGQTDPQTGKALQTLVIQNPPKKSGWSIWLTQFKINAEIDSTSGADLEYYGGSLYRIVPKGEYGDSIVLKYSTSPLRRQSWAPEGFTLDIPGRKAVSIDTKYIFQPAQAIGAFSYNKVAIKPWDMIPALKKVTLTEDGETTLGKIGKTEFVSGQQPGWYRITLNGDIRVEASDEDGAYYAGVTLNNISEMAASVPNMVIEDWPDLRYRGMMLDVSRHFTTKKDLLKFIDILSRYKVNYLHLHLGDDEGWRLEIEGLPELTSFGAKRGVPQVRDGKPVEQDCLLPSYSLEADNPDALANGFYSKEDFAEILRYAAARRITVIPEFDTPGHARAAIKAMEYRYRTTGDASFLLSEETDTSKYSSVQHYSDNAINVALESTYKFMSTVIDGVKTIYGMAGIDCPEIHIGGDEVAPGAWTGSPACRELMQKNGWEDTARLKEYYVDRMLDIAREKGVKLDGWQELPQRLSDATFEKAINGFGSINIWSTFSGAQRTEELPYRLANLGINVILSNVANTYADLAYNSSKLERGHQWGGYVDERRSFSLLPFDLYKSIRFDDYGNACDLSGLDMVNPKYTDGKIVYKEKLNNISCLRGVQAQLWTETVRSFDHVTSYCFPKILGVFERGWNANPSWAESEEAADPAFLSDFDRFYSIIVLREQKYYESNAIAAHRW